MDDRTPEQTDAGLAFADAVERILLHKRGLLDALDEAVRWSSSERFGQHFDDVTALRRKVVAATMRVTTLHRSVAAMFSARLQRRAEADTDPG
ncbi:hypothetical protein [Curtobacterium sp. 20TX0008]|uniref:hypothetical protein n=1 Tax=Curtobacterium sp. 20TX0008 TaxID=3022018 RepID=UPI00232DC97D|nr:hypothetical protein [Curtobacterium sp. 20TX0008]MDB6427097.1 hypothetical protein [Curtobacterium sp. 20TX0008]